MQDLKSYTIKTFEVGPMLNFIYLIIDNKTKYTAIIDPAWDLSEIYKYINDNNLILRKILLTHSHHDHVNAIDEILKIYDVPVHINDKERSFWGKNYDNFLINYGGDTIKLGDLDIKSIHSPGHTPGSTCYHLDKNLIAGDTLFVFGCGRCDLHGGSPEEMFKTLGHIKSSLDKNTVILPGHNYSIKKESTLNEELKGNPFFHFTQLDNFIEYRMKVHDNIRSSPYSPVEKN
jgi:glyoxylase-like metal-dependent hydrolase (beta-lactamase superfamily II)